MLTGNEIHTKFIELLILIDKMNISADRKFELRMMVSCAKYVEEVLIEDNTIPDLDYVERQIKDLVV